MRRQAQPPRLWEARPHCAPARRVSLASCLPPITLNDHKVAIRFVGGAHKGVIKKRDLRLRLTDAGFAEQ
jgi:hypothetical protein